MIINQKPSDWKEMENKQGLFKHQSWLAQINILASFQKQNAPGVSHTGINR